MDPADRKHEELKQHWTDKHVKVKDLPELKRFEGRDGRVITVNYNGKALVDFEDGGWYDITASEDYLQIVEDAAEIKKYKGTINSAQPFPEKQ